MKAYVSGPMTDYAEFNFPTFDAVAEAWRALGNEAVSPAERDREWLKEEMGVLAKPEDFPGYADGDVPAYSVATNFQYAKAMQWDLTQCAAVDAIIMLPGWQKSSGARAERFVAEMCGKAVYLAIEDYSAAKGFHWVFRQDGQQKRMVCTVAPALEAA